MNALAVRSPLNPAALVAGILAALVATAVLTGTEIPFISSVKTALLAFVVFGMAMCALGGIGRVGDLGQWAHPLSIVGYLLGGLILIVAASVWFGFQLPLIRSEMQGFVAVVVLAASKIALSLAPTATRPPAA